MTVLKMLRPTDSGYNEAIETMLLHLHSGGLVAADTGDLDISAIVADILQQVSEGGDAAAARLTSKFDNADINPDRLRVSADEIAAAGGRADTDFIALMHKAISNIRDYQEHIKLKAPAALEKGGRQLGIRYTPLDRVAVYVPGGQALYPSTVLMTVVPALVAGVKEVVMLSPPRSGDINPMVLALAAELGISEVYRLGGGIILLR